VKVRITKTPAERDVDGIQLDELRPGMIRVVSPTVGAWLIAQGYAYLEMRGPLTAACDSEPERRGRRSTDR
jgi:hypothetical protein